MLNKLLILISVILFSVISAYSEINFTDINDNSVFISVADSSKQGYFLLVKTVENENVDYKNMKYDAVIKNNIDYKNLDDFSATCKIIFKSTYPVKFSLNNLNPKTDYYIDVVFPDGKVISNSFNTLATPPKKQASNIIFNDVTDDMISLSAVAGDGEGTIIVVKRGKVPDNPPNGKEFLANPTLNDKKSMYGDGNFVIFNGKINRRESFKIDKLQFAKYYVQLFEYNGKGKYTHYNSTTASNNPRFKATLLPAPNILELKKIADNHYYIKWSDVKLAQSYFLEIAYNESFTELLDNYGGVDVGLTNEFEMMLDGVSPKVKTLYIRVCATAEMSKGKFSTTKKVDTVNK